MYQFIHIESYSRSTPRVAGYKDNNSGRSSSKSNGHCVSYIVKEAIREQGSTPHIQKPIPPNYLFGKHLKHLEATCEAWANSITDSRGHKLRKDALCLVAGVISAPHDISVEGWTKFRQDSVEWLKKKYGDALETIIEHSDERHPHLHFYCVPRPGERFETIHQGKAAASAAKAKPGAKKGIENQAYKQGMREYQDEFFKEVGIQNAMTRIGPRKRRLTREEWKLEQIQAAAAAKAIAVAETTIKSYKVECAAIIKKTIFDAKQYVNRTFQKAEIIKREAEKRGFEFGVKTLEALPWWKKFGALLSLTARERKHFCERVKVLEAENKMLSKEAESAVIRGIKITEELKVVNPKLKAAEKELLATRYKAKQTLKLREENDQLVKDLGDAEHKIERLQSRVKDLKSMVDEQTESKLINATKAKRYEYDGGLSR